MNKILPIVLVSLSFLVAQTDAEVKQAKEIIKTTGMTEAEARAAAKTQGYTNKQIDAAIQKELGKTAEQPPSVSTEKAGLPDLGKSNEPDTAEEELKLVSEPQPGRVVLRYYGYDIFKRDPAIFQASSVGAVDPDYLIGPGDEIILMLWGETQFRQVLTVDREGFVFIPEIGQVFVNGLNLSLLESKLFKVLSQSYASLNPEGRKPTTFLDVSLGNLRPLRIQVLGEVAQPGAYTVSPSATLFSALYYFNGPTTLGSLRDIRLIRAGEEMASIDFYDYLLTGKTPEDQKLQLDDVIFIPKRMQTVAIEGEINRPGIYELKRNETFSDLISMAGDLKITAYLNRAQIDRIVPFEQREEIGMDRMFTDVNLKQLSRTNKPFPLQDGDRIQIFSVLDLRLNVVELQGAVTRPGRYDLGESMRLSELIIKADSLLGDAYMDRVHVTRIKPDFSKQLIKLDLIKALSGDPEHDIELQGLDVIRVYGMSEMVPPDFVTIDGIIRIPGKYNFKTDMTLNDLIFEASGVQEDFPKYKIEISRIDPQKVDENNYAEIFEFTMTDDYSIINVENIQENGDVSIENTEFKLEPYDYISVRPDPFFKMQRKVTVSGSVYYPGVYTLLNPDENITDILKRAGGLRPKAYPIASTLTRNSEIIQMNIQDILDKPDSKRNIVMQMGDKIFVALKPDMTQIVGEVASPGIYKFLPGKRINDYIAMSGGFSMYAEKKDIWITFPNGQSKHYMRWFSNPKVLDGSVITVGREEEREPFDATEFAKEIASILADLAQVVVLILVARG